MDQAVLGSPTGDSDDREPQGLSYKFQRLREKLRAAIASGELSGKLPGERALAKRFHVNAKTLSKALTDLAAEGLLDRSIGRGTYVKGSEPASANQQRCLVICDPEQLSGEILMLLRASGVAMETVTDIVSLRPSFLNQFNAVIDLATDTPDAFIRDLVVRNVAVIVVGKEPRVYSTNAVVFDAPLAVSQAGRQLVLSGHRRIAAVEAARSSGVLDSLRVSVPRYASATHLHSCLPRDAGMMVEEGITAFVCGSVDLAIAVKAQLESVGMSVPRAASVVAIGTSPDQPPISGFFISRSEKVAAILQLLKEPQTSRPTTIWLAGRFAERGTLAAPQNVNHLRTGSADDSLAHSGL